MNSIEHDVNNIIRSVVKRNSAELDMSSNRCKYNFPGYGFNKTIE